MNDAFKIATVLGIPIRIHWTFPLVLLFFAGSGSAGALAALLLFGCVLLHELGHSLVARRFGIRVVDITFWPLGGMARMSAIPEDPWVEGCIASAGPAVNFVLAGLGFGLSLAALSVAGPESLPARLGLYFCLINLGMGLFNLLPAFPMDGGRILRAWFGRRLDWVSATERAVRIGRFIAALSLVASVWLAFERGLFCAMPLVALFIWFAGARELMGVRLRHGISPFGFSRFRQRPPEPQWRAAEAADAENGEEQGEPEPGTAQRPVAWEPAAARRGFDEATIRALERFRGRLRRLGQED